METENSKQALDKVQKPLHKHVLGIAKPLLVLALLVILCLGAATYNQYRKVNSLDTRGRALTAQVNQLKTSNSKLKFANASLSKSLQTIADEKTQPASQSSTASAMKVPVTADPTAPTTVPVVNLCDTPSTNSTSDGAFTVHGVEHLTPSFFNSTVQNDEVLAVFVTMKNLTDSNQSYSIFNFNALTDTGEVVRPRVYAGPGMGSIWNNSTLAAGGSTCQALLFDEGKTFVTAQMTPPGSTTAYTLPLPAAVN